MANILDIESLIREYFEKNYEDLKVIHIDAKKIVVQDSFSSIKLAVSLCNEREVDKLVLEYGNSSYDEKNIQEKFFNDFEDLIDQSGISILNPKLIKYPDVGYKIGNTVELLFKYSVTDYENGYNREHLIHCETFDLWEFSIGEFNVKVGDPTSIFRLIFNDYENDDHFVGWETYNTVLISGINPDNYQDVFQQVMFWIYHMCPSVYTVDFPEITQLCYEDEEADAEVGEISKGKEIFLKEYESRKFPLGKHQEPIYFYNAAKRINDNDIAFLYFYKVLEYFFIISQKENIKKNIDQYNKDLDIDALITAMHDEYFGKKEDLLLQSLIDSMDCDLINEIRNFAISNSLITQDDNSTLCNELYLHRNSIVHGKFEFKKMKLRLPNKINELEGRKWTELIEKLSFNLIIKHCYSK